MSNKSSDALFLLIQSLSKAEKKNFKLYITRNSKRGELRTVKLFDILEKLKEYDEAKILGKYQDLPKQQLLNIKGILYNEILSSLRLLQEEQDINTRLNEQMDYAHILYNRGLYIASLKILEKLREMAIACHQLSYLQQILFFEKKIESLHITRSMQGRAEFLINTSNKVDHKLAAVNLLSNLSLRLYSWFITNGHARNAEDETLLSKFFKRNLPLETPIETDFYYHLYLYQSYSWLNYVLQNFLQYYRYTQKWVDLFEQYPAMKASEIFHYLKGIHHLADAHFYLRNFKKLEETIDYLMVFEQSDIVRKNKAYRVLLFICLSTAKMNQHFIKGTFSDGVHIIAEIESTLETHSLYIDHHRLMVFNTKWHVCISEAAIAKLQLII